MASSPQLPQPSKIAETLRYFDKYDYPLTKEEILFWTSTTSELRSSPPTLGGDRGVVQKNNYFFFSGRQKIVAIRKQREEVSQNKWVIARQMGEKLKKFNFIQAIFVTGSLAMNNAKTDDDIDLMIVTTANTLWISRFVINIYLSAVRRHPNQKNVTNVVCTNLWLDENNLSINRHDLYTAHEIMQAKIVWDRNDIANKFLVANDWVKEYLPNAYKNLSLNPSPESGEGNRSRVRFLINYLFFIAQYLYMKPKMTTERVGLGFAFFHPRAS